LTLSLFMLGFAVSPLVYGPLSDRFGRRPALLAGLALFCIGGVVTTFSHSISVLLTARVVQGAGAGAGMTLAFAIVRDLFEGGAAQRRLAMITVVANLAPIVAPSIGTGLLVAFGWRSIYLLNLVSGVILIAMVWVSFTETLKTVDGKALSIVAKRPLPVPVAGTGKGNKADSVYGRLMRNAQVRRHVIVNGLGFAWMFAYVCGSPLVLLGTLGISHLLFSLMFACTGAGIVVGATLNGELIHRGVASGRLLSAGIVLALSASLALSGLTVMGWAHIDTVMPLLILSTFSFGLVAPSATHAAMEPFPELAGVTGGLLTSIQMILGAGASSLVVVSFPAFGILAMSGVMTGAALLAALIYFPGNRTAIPSRSVQAQ
jgi:DHA1 family bicyclomycin/chloramphenicol resistance-like MFS transporter